MSQEAAPERTTPEQPAHPSVPEQKGTGAPKGLLQQMEELMAALTADLSRLDADLQSSADRQEGQESPESRRGAQETRNPADGPADGPAAPPRAGGLSF
ncbi:hypothetical protein [Streptomyces sp. NPDC008121]|uniref:hypothetical protein n=1 Tax=Streptomyces sp. NPDC008121 TaxID=3364809 RepID=UPI0036E59B3D